MTDFAHRIAAATAAGDLQALAAIAIELNALHAATESRLEEMQRADAERRRGAANRQRRRRGGEPITPAVDSDAGQVALRIVTPDHVTSRDVTQHPVTDDDVTLPPLPPQTPPNPTHTHAHSRASAPAREAAREAQRGASVSHGLLVAKMGGERMADVDAYLDRIGARDRQGWYTELLRIVGPATGITEDDLAQGVRDAMISTPIPNRPGPLREFVQFTKRERHRAATSPPAAGATPSRNGKSARPISQPYDTSGNEAAARRLERDLGATTAHDHPSPGHQP